MWIGFVDKNAEAKRKSVEIGLTQVPNTSRHETSPNQRLVTDVVPFSLQYIITNPFRESQIYMDPLIEAGTTHESDWNWEEQNYDHHVND